MASKELDASVVDPQREMVEYEFGLKEDHAPGFTPYHHYPGTSTQIVQAPPAKATTYSAPPATPVFVAPLRAILHRSSSEPAFQAQDNQYYAPEPTFKVPDHYSYTPHFELPVETEKPPKNAEQEEIFRKSYAQPPPYPQWHAPAPQNPYPPPQKYRNSTGPSFRPRPEYRKERQQRKQTFTQLGESYASLFQRLRQLDVLRPIELKLPNPPPKNLDYSLRCAYCSDAPGNDTEKCWHLKSAIQELIDTNQIMVQSPEAPNINQNPLPAHAETHMIEIVYKDGDPEKPSKSVMIIRASEAKQGMPKVVVPRAASKPFIIVEGARIDPIIIKHVTQQPINNTKAVPWNYKQVIVTYKGKEVEEEVNETQGLTRLGRCFTPEELRKAEPFKDNPIPVKNPVTEEEAKEFLRKMKVQDYSIVEQLRKTPAQISLLSLLIHSDEHRRALMKILNEARVPDMITVNHLEKIANKIFEANRITFSDDELPLEGTKHNRALYLTVKCEDLWSRGGKDSIGDIMLELTIGLVEFTMEFQVLDVAVSYNLLLGRPWIHVAKAVPSSLHQMAKFKWDRQEIVVHGDENLCAYNDTSVPFIEAEYDKGP
ncbi:PREDICTED: uncharacterized protein LOC109231613 [Nicotiana attenuata]|uniref:uncharacterized protein LOC109231613 n=1 Tax=Nicotiana attenuata TaxID=49451 RepID=UPI0009051B13|nr:PREDICTED: uncharacterized protein LOC109231613 [Nicotiana attenuata]